MSIVYKLFTALCNLLPDSPLLETIQSLKNAPFIGYLNYFVNVSVLVDLMGLWCAGLIAYKVATVLYNFVIKLIK